MVRRLPFLVIILVGVVSAGDMRVRGGGVSAPTAP